MKRVPDWVRWSLLGVVLLVALLVGSGVFSSAPTTNAERAASIDARLKAPDSQSLSVAQSTSPSAMAVRREVRAQVDQNKSDDEIIASLEAHYGNSILLTPPGGGLSVVLWLVPALLVVAIALAIVSVARRRRLGKKPDA